MATAICRIKIPLREEQDRLVWAPSSTWDFSTRLTYLHNNRARLSAHVGINSKTLCNLWKSNLHNRHKNLIWKALGDAMPTATRMSFLPEKVANCLFCDLEVESMDHLFLICPMIKALWFNLYWQLHLEPYQSWDAKLGGLPC